MGLVLRENHTEAGRFFDRSRAFFVKTNETHLEIIAKPLGITAKKHQKTLKMSNANSKETSDKQQKKQRNTRKSKKISEQLLQTMKHFRSLQRIVRKLQEQGRSETNERIYKFHSGES